MKKYIRFFIIPLLLALVLLLQLLWRAAAGQQPGLRIGVVGNASSVSLISLLIEAGEVSGDLYQLAFASSSDSPEVDILVLDQPLQPPEREYLPAGFFDEILDQVRGRVLNGATALVTAVPLGTTENPRLAAELSSWCGVGQVQWLGYYVADLANPAELPAKLLEAAKADPDTEFPAEGAALVLFDPEHTKVICLRRGVELDRSFLRVSGKVGSVHVDSLLGSPFVIASCAGNETLLTASFGLLPAGEKVLAACDIPAEFSVLSVQHYGRGSVWTAAFDLSTNLPERISPSFVRDPAWPALFTLDEPNDSYAKFSRLSAPVWGALTEAALAAGGQRPAMETKQRLFRARRGTSRLETSINGTDWSSWFVKGINLGPATPGHWFGEPPVDEGLYLEWFEAMSAAGFNTVRVYTLLPPAFYRALYVWNSARAGQSDTTAAPLYLIQEIWPEEEVPEHNLTDPEYLRRYFEESDRTIDALFGRANIAERPYRAWGAFTADISPWLAAVLVGRELEPEEVLATAAARPDYRFDGAWFTVGEGHPAESVLAAMAEQAAERMAAYGNNRIPVGFVSWPILDVLCHDAEWQVDAASPPHNDKAELDFRVISAGPANEPGFFAAFHIYPNYPDFMINSLQYARQSSGDGYERYGAYLDDLLGTLDGIPLLVAEFGLATGYGTAHLHPEGLDHGGLSEAAQAEGLVRLFKTIARRETAGAVLFQWADEWAKKTWTTEPYTIPYDRNPLWHNVIDPEQNYGIMAWDALPFGPQSDGLISAQGDPAFLHLQFDLAAAEALVSAGSAASMPVQAPGSPAAAFQLNIGLDIVPGRTGEFRLLPDPQRAPLAPQGSEFVVRVLLRDGRLVSADLLAQADYNRGGGRLYPRYSALGGFTRILSLVNAASRNREGGVLASRWEDGSRMTVANVPEAGRITAGNPAAASTRPQTLAEYNTESALLSLHLPWSRLNFADPSSRSILLDTVADARTVVTRDSLAVIEIEDIGIWAQWGPADAAPLLSLPAADRSFRFRLPVWEYPQARFAAKRAYDELAAFLPGWAAAAGQ